MSMKIYKYYNNCLQIFLMLNYENHEFLLIIYAMSIDISILLLGDTYIFCKLNNILIHLKIRNKQNIDKGQCNV
jgi:hypothetical protein